jgi:hypothetical protein
MAGRRSTPGPERSEAESSSDIDGLAVAAIVGEGRKPIFLDPYRTPPVTSTLRPTLYEPPTSSE